MSAAPIYLHRYRTRRHGPRFFVKCCLMGLGAAILYWAMNW